MSLVAAPGSGAGGGGEKLSEKLSLRQQLDAHKARDAAAGAGIYGAFQDDGLVG